MKIEKVSEEIVCEKFKQGFNCAQIVLGYVSDKVGIDNDKALKISTAFGGMFGGHICGCVTGAIMAFGLKYGYDEPNAIDQKNAVLAKKAEFERKFIAENKSVVCKEILGHDPSIPEELAIAMEKNLIFTVCPKAVCSACKILDDIQ